MSETNSSGPEYKQLSREEQMAAHFASLVINQTNMALMLLGQVPNPETGERVQDLDAARVFIDQLEMLDVKTKGNLDKREDQLLKQSLTTLRMAFVEAVESAPPTDAATERKAQPPGNEPAQAAPAAGGPAPSDAPASSSPQEESHKKFSKKY